MANITQNLSIQGNPKSIIEAITTQAGMEGWWTTTCEVKDDDAEFRFEHGNMRVAFRYDSVAADRVAMTCTGNHNNPEWQDTTLLFELEPNGKSTELHFVHDQWKKEGTEVYNMCVGGWDFFLNSLKSYIEKGEGTPHDKPE